MADLQPIVEVKREDWIAIISQTPVDHTARFLTIIGPDCGLSFCFYELELDSLLRNAVNGTDAISAFVDVATRNRITLPANTSQFRPGLVRIWLTQIYVDIPTVLLQEAMTALQATGGAQ